MAKAPIQLLVNLYDGTLIEDQKASDFKKYRAMRLDPTIALCRAYVSGMIMSGSWTADADEEDEAATEQLEFLEEHVLPLRCEWLRVALNKFIDFGWSAAEVEYETVEGVTKVKRIQHLKNDWTWARYDVASAEFAGFKTLNQYNAQEVFIDAEHSLFCSFDEEGLGGYGEPVLKRLSTVYDSWNAGNDALSRYNQKIAGGFLLIRAPQGLSLTQSADDEDGVAQERDNQEIAARLASTMKSNGALTLPALQQIAGMQAAGWTVEFVESEGQQQNFVDGLKYYDQLKVRAFGLSDRSVLEAEFGSKADASVATSAAELHLQSIHEMLTDYFDTKLVQLLLTVNFGEPKAWLKAVPLSDNRVQLYKDLLTALMADPAAGPEIAERLDIDQLADVLSLPLLPLEEVEARNPPMLPGTQPDASQSPPQPSPSPATEEQA